MNADERFYPCQLAYSWAIQGVGNGSLDRACERATELPAANRRALCKK